MLTTAHKRQRAPSVFRDGSQQCLEPGSAWVSRGESLNFDQSSIDVRNKHQIKRRYPEV